MGYGFLSFALPMVWPSTLPFLPLQLARFIGHWVSFTTSLTCWMPSCLLASPPSVGAYGQRSDPTPVTLAFLLVARHILVIVWLWFVLGRCPLCTAHTTSAGSSNNRRNQEPVKTSRFCAKEGWGRGKGGVCRSSAVRVFGVWGG